MAKLRDPALFSQHFGIDPQRLADRGIFDPVLNGDTKLFIDPMLLDHAANRSFAADARQTFNGYFETVIKLIAGSKARGDVPWRAAERKLQFPEVPFTCLGYGASTIRGSGGGTVQTSTLVQTASEIIELGVTDPDLFVAMALIEEGIGPDRISDMTTKIILPVLIAHTQAICKALDLQTGQMTFTLSNGERFGGDLPRNPHDAGGGPVILVPRDVLRDLPVATDWDSVGDAASKNAALRTDLNERIAGVWAAKTRRDKATIRGWALSNDASFRDLLDLLKGIPATSYDFSADPAGEVFWSRLLSTFKNDGIQKIDKRQGWTREAILSVVDKIIENFRHLVEDRRLSEELYHEGKPRAEKAAQRLFFVVAHAFCKANDLDLTPEADTGNGPVDFKVSSGFTGRVLVEIKLSTNGKVVAGYTRQLDTYATAEEAAAAYYVVVDVGQMGGKLDKLYAERNVLVMAGKPVRPIIVIDAEQKPSASKL
ncbi:MULTISPECIES: hypothetical protein [Methylobacterium]|uniref:Protein NO VEIN C-terminal domain-containing protein n=2 Tax=Pseudomonadota TaxID=1224 RepID=A0ABQ4STG2_9HYPH|nr:MULTISPECIES: hypothetical protein [Methylobacterium]PIU07533.1 MAG: hypothetical protein COT56_04745 [Methylobacterium sp. CG09_land_8_20_14_0_10_71_15]PIU13320.1 MAG: hypothetical protein COT28_11885 [Methylobacterium sp. CG08_land_8_20_14_0_20_71_15]GBU17768.1 hypothetical protein AwMethylo_19830 [Methylobacterium sp.]GJE06402.1 hypothetical protein AOPFMNJM_1719 [Methylobacterium jeotgali]